MQTSDPLKVVIKNNLTIPTLPEVVTRIQQLVEDPESGTREIGAVVAEDAPLAAKVLRIANSAYYGLQGRCISTEQATTLLGVRVLRNIVTQVSVISAFEHLEKDYGSTVQELWSHAIRTAQVSSHLAGVCKAPTRISPPEFYACGLLHDIGKVVMLDGLGSKYIDAVEAARRLDEPAHVAEKREFGYDHADVGAAVSARWGLPEVMTHTIQFHHNRGEAPGDEAAIAVIGISDLVVHRAAEGNRDEVRSLFDDEAMSLLRLEQGDIDGIVDFALPEGDESGWYDDPW